MNKIIAMGLSLLLLITALTGCGRRNNVSENEDGKITEETDIETTLLPTDNTVENTESTSTTTGSTESGTTNTSPGSRSRNRTGIIDGNGKF